MQFYPKFLLFKASFVFNYTKEGEKFGIKPHVPRKSAGLRQSDFRTPPPPHVTYSLMKLFTSRLGLSSLIFLSDDLGHVIFPGDTSSSTSSLLGSRNSLEFFTLSLSELLVAGVLRIFTYFLGVSSSSELSHGL